MASLGFSLGFGAQSNEDKRYFELLSNAAKKREIANLPGATNAQKKAANNADKAATAARPSASTSLSQIENQPKPSYTRFTAEQMSRTGNYESPQGGKRSRRTRRNRKTRRTRRNRKH